VRGVGHGVIALETPWEAGMQGAGGFKASRILHALHSWSTYVTLSVQTRLQGLLN
jgi:hypothetical protein